MDYNEKKYILHIYQKKAYTITITRKKQKRETGIE